MVKCAPQSITERTDSAPVVISQDEYDRIWKPAGWKLIVIGPTSTWRQEWGEWEAIRDIVQNCLDEAEKYYYGYDKRGLWIADMGRGVAVADFLLGPPKLKPDWARGQFGEGMKIAALALLRKGYPIHVETIGRELWIIFLEQSVNGKVETLAALWQINGSKAGTKFHVIGYTGPVYQQNFAVNLPRSSILAEVPSPITKPKQRYNQLIRAEGMAASASGGRIYSRDIYLMDIISPFSYNLWGFPLAPDRHGPAKEQDMYTDMGRLWSGIKKVALLKELIVMVVDPPKTRTVETQHLYMEYMGKEPTTGKLYDDLMKANAGLWQEAWNGVVGRDKVIRRDESLDGMVKHLGYQSVSVQWGVRRALAMVIKTDRQLIEEMAEKLSAVEGIPDSQLTPCQFSSLALARAIALDFSGVSSVIAAIIPPASDMIGRTAGLYEFETAMIKIHTEMLLHAADTVGIMVHELGHHVAYQRTLSKEKASDLTPEHTAAMEFVAKRIFTSLAAGRYDNYLKNVTW